MIPRFFAAFSIFVFVFPHHALARISRCPAQVIRALIEDGSVVTNPDDSAWLKQYYLDSKFAGHGEPSLRFSSYESARNYVQNFPLFRSYGFDPTHVSNWTRIRARLEKSSFFGKYTGWERKLPNGDFARYRFDYEPNTFDPHTGKLVRQGRGAHYNIELSVVIPGRVVREKFAYSIDVLCGGKVCTQAQALAYLNAMNR